MSFLSNVPNPFTAIGKAVGAVGQVVNTAATTVTWGLDVGQNIVTGDIRAKDATSYRNGAYDFSYKAFPYDLSNDYHGHYMVININVPTGIFNRDEPRGAFGNWFTTTTEFSTVDRAKFASIPGADGTFDGASTRAAFSTGRRTKRITQSIALYMPSGLVYNQQNKYEEVSMTALMGKAAATGAGLAVGARSGSLDKAIAAGAKARSIADSAGRIIGQASSLAGYPINPRVEVLFSHTDLRSFRFEVLMAPRNEKESQSIEAIVKTLRFHASPELDPQTAGFTFIPPAEFDISFYNKGQENVKIPRINTCVLNVIEVDYAPTDGTYSTFQNGHPVAVRLSLGFTEVEPLHKARIVQGF
jgi:hypothetical protein